MSVRSRIALAALALVLILAPIAALHPVITHLYSAGFKSFPIEFTHPELLWLMSIALAAVLPAGGFIAALVSAARATVHMRALTRVSREAELDGFHYRLLPIESVTVFTAGVFRPVTFVSSGAESALGDGQLRAALLHEAAHQRSKDILWRLLLGAVGRGFAFVPWISGVVESETLRTECAADDYAIRAGARRVDLFEAIVTASAAPPSPVRAGLSEANVELRLRRLIHPGTPLPGRPTGSLVALIAAAALPTLAAHLIAITAAVGTARLVA